MQVSPEDYTIWALTANHKVYYKKEASADFELFAPMVGMQVKDLAGYSFNDMYFVLEPNILAWYKNGTVQTMTVPNPLVTKINGIAAISSVYNTSAVIYPLREGWLAIGTNDNLYALAKGTNNITHQDQFTNSTDIHHDNWDYLQSSFKGATFSYNYPYDYCNTKSTHTNANISGYTQYITANLDLPPMPSKVNTSLMSLHPVDLFNGAPYVNNRIFNLWGTDNGLYVTLPQVNCVDITPPLHFFNVPVNAIKEAYALPQIKLQHYLFIATDEGIQYTPSTIYGIDYKTYDSSELKFVPFNAFPNVKATDILVDSRKDDEPSPFVFVCDRVAWVSTVSGVYKVYLSYDNEKYKELKLQEFAAYGGPIPVYNTDGDAVFGRCDNKEIAKVTLLNHANTSLLIKWFKGTAEVTAWQGKQSVDLQEMGTYHAEITSLCEGIIVKSINFIIQQATDPTITFNYADNITICEGEAYTLTTQNNTGYKYQWYKNGQPIGGVIGNSYQVLQAGLYHVEVSNCGTYFKSSKNLNFTVNTLSAPSVIADKPFYCSGDVATLKIDNPNGYAIKWYLDGTELINYANAATITGITAGSYTAKFISGTCEKSSAAYTLILNQPLAFDIIKGKQTPLCFNETILLSTSVPADSYLWSTGETTRSINIKTPGHYTVTATAGGSCPSLKSVDITALPPVDVPFITDGLLCTIAHETLKINAPNGYLYYTWNGIQSTNAYLNVTQPGHYTLIVTTAQGCTATTSFDVKPWCREVIIPNTFTPNNDNINDTWIIGGLENDPDARIQIFNRNGTRLLDYRAAAYQWDGTYKGQILPVGTYYYTINTKNNKAVLNGSITIIR